MKIVLVLFLTFALIESRGIQNLVRQLRIYFTPTTTPLVMQMARDRNKIQEQVEGDVPFPCLFLEYMYSNDYKNSNKSKSAVKNPINWSNVELPRGRSLEPPTSVHKLRPGDIDVIGAIGDSLTVGIGILAVNIRQIFLQNRGLSWSIGGQGTWREFLTVPNILKVFNPDLIGYSLGDSLAFQKDAQFNVAEAGAFSEDLVFMTKALISRIKNDPRVDLKNHWKLISLMIGDNDFCVNFCGQKSIEEVLKKHRSDLYESLRLLKENLPRTLVQKIVTPSIRIILEYIGTPEFCELMLVLECPCFFGEPHRLNREKFLQAIEEWRRIDEEIINLPEFQNSDDFTIVNQLFTQDFVSMKNDEGFTDFTTLSADCFHFSQKGGAIAVNALWNNMLEPVGNKSRNWQPLYERFLCPTIERPYITTNKNSFPIRQDYETNFISRKQNSWTYF